MKPISLLTALSISVTLLSSPLMASDSKDNLSETYDIVNAGNQSNFDNFKDKNPSLYIYSPEEDEDYSGTQVSSKNNQPLNKDENNNINISSSQDKNSSDLEGLIALYFYSDLLVYINFSEECYNHTLTEDLVSIVTENDELVCNGKLQDLITFAKNKTRYTMDGTIKSLTKNYLALNPELKISSESLKIFYKEYS